MKNRKYFSNPGIPYNQLSNRIKSFKSSDANWKSGKVFGFVYHPGNEIAMISEEYYRAFYYENTLNPSTFPSLKKFETDIVHIATELMNGGKQVAGSITSGGTESIFLAMKVARDLAREKNKDNILTQGNPDQYAEDAGLPEVVLPETIHPAFLKACQYLDVRPVKVPVGENKKPLAGEINSAITSKTILIACSAPCFPYGVIDPVTEIGKIARSKNIPFHVDACLGGFMLPFLEELGYPIPEFDFRVPGVTSISMDAHKYGYAPKGTSMILYRHRRFRRKQFFIDTEWPGGIFASTTFLGTKSGGPQAGAWAIMNHLGRNGYREMAASTMKTAERLKSGINSIEGLSIIGEPDMTVMAFTSQNGDIYTIGNELGKKGWHLDYLQFPEALHLTINKLNVGKEEEFLKDLGEIAQEHAILSKESLTTRASVQFVG